MPTLFGVEKLQTITMNSPLTRLLSETGKSRRNHLLRKSRQSGDPESGSALEGRFQVGDCSCRADFFSEAAAKLR